MPTGAVIIRNFNSHAHVERDRDNVHPTNGGYISTHTLTWSVTVIKMTRQEMLDISTHTLTWSVTHLNAAT